MGALVRAVCRIAADVVFELQRETHTLTLEQNASSGQWPSPALTA